jgi:hypothetical protein
LPIARRSFLGMTRHRLSRTSGAAKRHGAEKTVAD